MTRVNINSEKCQGHGRCALITPKYFDVDDSGFGLVLLHEAAEEDLPDLREAVLSCPERAVELAE